MNDQTAKADAGKLRLTLVPPQIIYDIAVVREYGCRKYPEGGPENWRRVDEDRYFDALLRHVLAAWRDRDSVDDESGLSHLAHAACNLAFILQMRKEWEL